MDLNEIHLAPSRRYLNCILSSSCSVAQTALTLSLLLRCLQSFPSGLQLLQAVESDNVCETCMHVLLLAPLSQIINKKETHCVS